MIIRIEVVYKDISNLSYLQYKADVYTINVERFFSSEEMEIMGKALSNSLIQEYYIFIYDIKRTNFININQNDYRFVIENSDWSLEIGYLPSIKDNSGNIAKQIISELFKYEFKDNEEVHSSCLLLGKNLEILQDNAIEKLYNPLIEYCKLAYKDNYEKYSVKFFGNKYIKQLNNLHLTKYNNIFLIPFITEKYINQDYSVDKKVNHVKSVNLNISDKDLELLSKQGIDGKGCLGLSLPAMKVIRDYFYNKEQRNPYDIELETIAQTWSEHCKHNIFSSPIDDITDGLYSHYIKRATYEINSEICVSVFSDNAGAIVFDDEFLIVDKVETHNSPSALDPFGGAITGILGVNRDIIGFGKGAKPVMNSYFFCFAESVKQKLYRNYECSEEVLSPNFIMDGVIKGVNVGGNCSGIPTALGSMYFDDRFCGKPLVFVGSCGIIPRRINGNPSHIKEPQKGDYIVIVGGRVGRDGIHGATFSSKALTNDTMSSMVQIGDSITQKKLSDAIIKEARDLGLYNSITDNGAGGLSSSVGEMGKNGFVVYIEKVLLKAFDIDPWEIWISESQERMTLAVPPHNFPKLRKIMDKHDVEVSVIGEFNNSGRALVKYNNQVIMDIETEFLHNGNPKTHLFTKEKQCNIPEISNKCYAPLEVQLHNMMKRPNICSKEFVIQQYDYEVQGSSIIKPISGKGRVCSDAIVFRPILTSKKGVVKSQGFGSSYGEIDAYHMAACAVDTAIRNCVAVGGNLKHLALLDNFCWSNSNDPERLWQLKRAAQACYDYATAFKTPFISGKDSMFNDFEGYVISPSKDQKESVVTFFSYQNHKKIVISAPPSLLISAVGVVEDIEQSVSLDVKIPGDLIYMLGLTYDELGQSEYQLYSGAGDNNVPKVDAKSAKKLYIQYTLAVAQNLVVSSISLGIGGMIIGLIKSLIGGKLGAKIDLYLIPREGDLIDEKALMFSESQSRLLITIASENRKQFELLFRDLPYANIGIVTQDRILSIKNIININLAELEESYKSFSNAKIKESFKF